MAKTKDTPVIDITDTTTEVVETAATKAAKAKLAGEAKVAKEERMKRLYAPATTKKTIALMEKMHRAFPKVSTLGIASRSISHSIAVPTGSAMLDWGMGSRGLLQNKIIELYGPPSQGKTLLSLQMIVKQQRAGKTCAYIDAERSHDEASTQAWMTQQGVDIDNLIYIRDTAERCMDMVHFLVEDPDVGIIVIDSIASLVLDKVVFKDDMGKERVRSLANLMPTFLGKFNVLTKGATLVLINQVRASFGAQGLGGYVIYDTPGGWALKHYAHVRMEVRGSQLTDKVGEDNVMIGLEMTVRIVKNKLSTPRKKCTIRYYWATGLDWVDEVAALALKHNLITQSGAWYSYSGPGFNIKANGMDAYINSILETPLCHEPLYKAILDARTDVVETPLYEGEAE